MTKVKVGNQSRVKIKWNVLPIDHSKEKEKELIAKFSRKYNIPKEHIAIEPVFSSLYNNHSCVDTSNISENIQDPHFQHELFKEYISLKNIENVDFDTLINIDEIINSKVDVKLFSNSKKYKINWIKWDNFMSYGEKNCFDFTTLKGLVLLTSNPANQGGKTTFCLDLIRFLLFGKVTSRDNNWVYAKLFNNHIPSATEVVVEGCITIDGNDYIIKRVITRPKLEKRTSKSKVTQKLSYYRLIENEYHELVDDESCNETTVTNTNKAIKEAIGNEQDFDLMICVDSDNLKSLISLKDTERGRLISRWIGLLPLEEKDKIAREYFNKVVNPQLMLNTYSKTEIEEDNMKLTECIEENGKTIDNLEKKRSETKKQIVEYNEQRDLLLQSKKNVDDSLTKIDVVTLNTKIENIVNEGKIKRQTLKNNQTLLDEIGEISFSEEQYDTKQEQYNKFSLVLNNLSNDSKNTIAEIDALKKGEFCPTCGAKLKDVDNHAKIQEKETELSAIQGRIEKGKKVLSELSTELEQLKKTRQAFNDKCKLELIVDKNKAEIEILTQKYKEATQLKKNIEDMQDAISFNNQLEMKIHVMNTNIQTAQGVYDDNSNMIATLMNENESSKTIIKNNMSILEQIKKEEKVLYHWKVYLELIGKNGISKLVLRNTLPLINGELHRLLHDVCDFDVEVSIDDKNDVSFSMIHDNVKSNLASGSGFEQTVASLALRCVLGKISTFSKPSFVVFDEVLGGVASDNYDNVKKLFDKIVTSYDFVFQITHNKQIFDWHNHIVTVYKENNISRIAQE